MPDAFATHVLEFLRSLPAASGDGGGAAIDRIY
jgi:hypothetical protein